LRRQIPYFCDERSASLVVFPRKVAVFYIAVWLVSARVLQGWRNVFSASAYGRRRS
jgi:hypothetical protein